MKSYDLQGIEINAPFSRVFSYLEDARKLPDWTDAFASVEEERAVMRTPRGETEIRLRVHSKRDQGTVDWEMVFPDGSVGHAYSRVVELSPERCAYSFVLPAPPAPLEELEGILEEQSKTLAKELQTLKKRLED